MALLVGAPLVSGCSFIFVKGPPERPDGNGESELKCTSSRAAPVIDVLVTGFQVYRTVAAAAATDADYAPFPISREADIALGSGLSTLFAWSAIHGFNKTSACSDAKRDWKAKSRDQQLATANREPRAPEAKSRREIKPPQTVGGFAFGSDVAQARANCEKAGYVWFSVDAASFRCSGTVRSMGAAARADLGFCDDGLCSIAVLIAPGSRRVAAVEAFKRMRYQLGNRYDRPIEERYELEMKCPVHMTLEQCLSRGDIEAVAKWEFPTGHTLLLRLELEKAEGSAGQVVLRIEYKAPRAGDNSARTPASGEEAMPSSEPAPANPPQCVPGETIACAGPAACVGYQVCAEDGRSYGACLCN